MGGLGSGPKPIFSDEYHKVLRERVRASRRRRKTANVYLSLMAGVLVANIREADP